MLLLDQVKFSYGKERIYEISFLLDKPGCFLLLGESGIGKTTLLNLIGGFLNIESGKIFLANENIAALPPYKRKISFFFQENNIFPHLTVYQNIALALSKSMKIKAKDMEKVEFVFSQLSILHLLNLKGTHLSGGQHQRVGIARCLLQRTSLVLMDEPFSALDAEMEKKVVDLIYTNVIENDRIFILATHRYGFFKNKKVEKLVMKKSQCGPYICELRI